MWSCQASPPFCWKFVRRFNTPSRNGEVHTVFLAYSTYLEPQRLVVFGLQLCPINHKNFKSWNLKAHSFRGKCLTSWNKLIIFNGDMKCVLLIGFLAQNLIISDNPISIWLQWIWNSSFWVEVENLRKLETIVSFKPLLSLSQENRKTLPSALLDTSTT